MKKLLQINPKKIAVFRALQLGDLLCAMPAVRALKKFLPDAELTLLGLPWAQSFVDRFPMYFSKFIHFPGYPGLPEQPYSEHSYHEFTQIIREEKFDIILQLHGNGSIINPLMQDLGARYLAGYYDEENNCPDKNLFMKYPEGFQEVERHLQLMRFLEVPLKGKHLEFPLTDIERKKMEGLSRRFKLQKKRYVCIHPGARDPRRWWSPENFATIADSIADKGYQIVLTGTEAERENALHVQYLMEAPAIDCVGKTDLGTLAALIEQAKMIFSNDTGVSHIAAALKTPSVVVFLASDPSRWAPLDKELHRIIYPEHSDNIHLVLKKTESVLAEGTGDHQLEIEL